MTVQSAQFAADQTTCRAPAHLSRLVLTGFMGAGKSTIGRLLADRLGWEFIDLDTSIESRAGLTVPAIFAIHGEAHFRQLESQALASTLGRENVVLALGGGAPEVLANRLLLEQTPATAAIFLDAPFTILYDRCIVQASAANANAALADAAQSRPLLTDPATAEARFHSRRPIYQQLAHHTIDTTVLTTAETVAALLAQLHTLPHPRP